MNVAENWSKFLVQKSINLGIRFVNSSKEKRVLLLKYLPKLETSKVKVAWFEDEKKIYVLQVWSRWLRGYDFASLKFL